MRASVHGEHKLYQVVNAIHDLHEEFECPPTVREVAIRVGLKSTQSAYSYIERGLARGLLRKLREDSGSSRNVVAVS